VTAEASASFADGYERNNNFDFDRRSGRAYRPGDGLFWIGEAPPRLSLALKTVLTSWRGVSLERSMHSAQKPAYAEGNGHSRIRLVLNGIFQRTFKAASGIARRLRCRIVNVLRCVNCIASNACGVFLCFSNGSTEVWTRSSRFRHGSTPLEVVLC
jgi:hypothetical protein